MMRSLTLPLLLLAPAVQGSSAPSWDATLLLQQKHEVSESTAYQATRIFTRALQSKVDKVLATMGSHTLQNTTSFMAKFGSLVRMLGRDEYWDNAAKFIFCLKDAGLSLGFDATSAWNGIRALQGCAGDAWCVLKNGGGLVGDLMGLAATGLDFPAQCPLLSDYTDCETSEYLQSVKPFTLVAELGGVMASMVSAIAGIKLACGDKLGDNLAAVAEDGFWAPMFTVFSALSIFNSYYDVRTLSTQDIEGETEVEGAFKYSLGSAVVGWMAEILGIVEHTANLQANAVYDASAPPKDNGHRIMCSGQIVKTIQQVPEGLSAYLAYAACAESESVAKIKKSLARNVFLPSGRETARAPSVYFPLEKVFRRSDGGRLGVYGGSSDT